MGRLVTVAACSLNQWSLDWEGNLARIKKSILIAKSRGARLRSGPELEITGYGLLDHFLESDTYLHSWEMIKEILTDRELDDCILDIGAPIMHKNRRYNCRIMILNGKILFIRPKQDLANDGNYREMRYFSAWQKNYTEEYYLPRMIAKIQGSPKIPIGDVVLSTADTCIGCETCEELFTLMAPHNAMSLDGVEIFTNSSGSHHELRKLDRRMSLIREGTLKAGGIYLYSNQLAGDGDRLGYDGCASIFVNGEIVAQGAQFTVNDVDVVSAVVDIEQVRSARSQPTRGVQSLSSPKFPRVETSFSLSSDSDEFDPNIVPSTPQSLRVHCPEEEIALGPAVWLWDYLRRSKTSGFLLPLSGGLDSCSTAAIIFSMCRIVIQALEAGNLQVEADVRRIASWGETKLPSTAEELCNRVLHCVYMGMASQSSKETRSRAERLAKAIGAYFVNTDIDEIFNAHKTLLVQTTGVEPRFKVHGGSTSENLTLQNIQARSRLVTAYSFAQHLPTSRKRPGGGSLLVLASGNVDECLRGYLTKYDCSSADLNPIGSISKTDLKSFLRWSMTKMDLPILEEFLDATPTAELEPITSNYVQSDEADMGMTYAELSIFGRSRKEAKNGPYSTFTRLLHEWKDQYTPREIADKTKRFYHFYAINRHKMTTMTPAYHAEAYSCDDNRFDLRPFLYPPFFESWSFKKIDRLVEELEAKGYTKVNGEA